MIDFGRVEFSTPPGFVQRSITLRNAGTSGTSPAAALRMLSPAANLEALEGDLLEFSVSFGPELANGLEEGESTELTFALMPRSPGPKRFRFTLFTNDPLQRELVFDVRASVEVSP